MTTPRSSRFDDQVSAALPTGSARRSPRRLGMLPLAALALGLPAAQTQADPPPPPSRVDALVDFQFSDKYLTPRGMIVQNRGLTFQPLVLGLVNVYKDDGFINAVTLVPGVWNDFASSPVSIHAPYGAGPKTSWVEIDPIAGVSVDFAKRFTLSVTYTAFNMQILDIGTSQHLENKLAFNDTDYLGAFALHPYVLLWQELSAKATDADVPAAVGVPTSYAGKHPQPGSSHYFEVGVDPGYTWQNAGGFKLEAPMRVLLPDERFYGDYYAKSSTVGLFELGLKGSIPMNFISSSYGHWSCYAGFRYVRFEDDNLYHLNVFNSPGAPTRDTYQVYLGFKTFF